MEPRPPPAAPTQTPTNRQKVPNPQSPSLTGQGPRAQASTAPARPHRGPRQPPRPQPPGRHILQGRHNRPPRAPDGTGAGVGPPPPHLPGTRPTARRPPGNHPHVYPGPESVQMLLAQGDPPIRPNRHPRPPRPPPQRPREARCLRGRRGRMATQRHQHPRPLRRSHGTLPPGPGRGVPPNGHARPHSHHRRHERRPHPSGPRRTGHTPGPSSPRHHRNAGARGPNSQPRRPTIPLPPPNGCRPIPHRRMLWRPHHHHPSGGPIWTPPAGTHRP